MGRVGPGHTTKLLALRVLSGPGLWLNWLDELDRKGRLEELLAGGAITRTLREAPHGHAYDRTLTGKMTVICVLTASLFPGAGYDTVLATAFGLPGLHPRPLLRLAAHVRAVTRRWIAAAIGGYLDGENPLAHDLEGSFTAGILNPRRPGLLLHGPVDPVPPPACPAPTRPRGELVT